MLLSVQSLTKTFPGTRALDGVDFELAAGEVHALLGENGAGKSTLIKCLTGAYRRDAGEIRLEGARISPRSTSEAQELGIGTVYQEVNLLPNLTVAQNLAFFAGVYGLSRRRRRERSQLMVEIFDLGPHLSMSAKDLPLGLKQRLALACAVLHEPEALFLDEPTSGVDPITRREFWSHINGLVEKGVTVLVTTHFMDEAEYCDRISLIYRGHSIALGSPDELKAQVAGPAAPDPTMEDAFVALVRRSEAAVAA